MKNRALFLVALAAMVIRCGDTPATEIVVLVHADAALRMQIDAVDVQISGRAGGGTFEEARRFSIPVGELPFQFSVAPADGDTSRQWQVVAEATAGGGLVRQTAVGTYLEDESRVLYVILTADCVGRMCGAEQTCIDGGCELAGVPVGDLDRYEGGFLEPPPDGACIRDEDCPDPDGLFCNGGAICDPSSPMAGARGCAPGPAPCEDCDEEEDLCAECADADGDGFPAAACGGDDCDDANAEVNPMATEVPGDGVDNDCDPATPDTVACADGAEVCDDDCDNDEDGFTDCADSDCDADAACECPTERTPERSAAACSDGCDNDQDGFTDCTDRTCHGVGTCGNVCGCDVAEGCLTRRQYGKGGVCGPQCNVGSDATAEPMSWGSSDGGCGAGLRCWWDGSSETDSAGICARGEMGAMFMPPNIGAACTGASTCSSPYGFGRCLDETTVGFVGGYCSVQDCAAPGVRPGACGPPDTAVCHRRGLASYCLRTCMFDSECRGAGHVCVSVGGPDRVCLPECGAGAAGCGMFGECEMHEGKSVCLPSTGF